MTAAAIAQALPEIGGLIDKVSTLLKQDTSTPFVGGGLSEDAASKLLWPGDGKSWSKLTHTVTMTGASDLVIELGVSWDYGGHAGEGEEAKGHFITNARLFANLVSSPWDLSVCHVTGDFNNAKNVGTEEDPIAEIGCEWTLDWSLWSIFGGHEETLNYGCTIRGDNGGDATITRK